jgi:hypothetical protein
VPFPLIAHGNPVPCHNRTSGTAQARASKSTETSSPEHAKHSSNRAFDAVQSPLTMPRPQSPSACYRPAAHPLFHAVNGTHVLAFIILMGSRKIVGPEHANLGACVPVRSNIIVFQALQESLPCGRIVCQPYRGVSNSAQCTCLSSNGVKRFA